MSAVRFTDAVTPLLVDIDTVIPWDRNPRSGDLDALKESIRRNGFYQPVVVQRSTNAVIAGNHRCAALRELGATQVPVVYVDATDEEATRIALADNRTSDLAFYDDHQLFELLDNLIRDGDGLEGTGYDRNAYQLLLEGLDTEAVTGGIRQGIDVADRLDEYNELDLRSLILPYSAAEYDVVAAGLVALRARFDVETNAGVVMRLVEEAMEEAEADA